MLLPCLIIQYIADTTNSGDDDPIDTTDELQDQLKALSNLWLIGMESLGNATFDGSDDSVSNLYGLINSGAFASKNGDGAFEMRQHTESIMYAKLIPMAWSYDNNNPTLNPSGMVVVDSATACSAGDKCPDQVPGFPNDGLSRYMTTDAAQKTCHCYNGNMYYLVQLFGLARDTTAAPNNGYNDNYLDTPPGIDDLDGTKWGGLTLAKFVEG